MGNPVAAFDSFTLTGDEVGGGGGGGGGTPSGPSYDDQFDDATLDKTRWNAIVRDTPAEYDAGRRRADDHDRASATSTRATPRPPPNNFLLQDASHAGADWVIETKISGNTIDGGYAQGGLMAYVDGDNYVKLDAITDVEQHGHQPDRAPLGGRRRDPEPAGERQPSPRPRPPATSGCG